MNMNSELLVKLLGISCQVTCGCGNELIPYTKSSSENTFFLGCKPYSQNYDHPQKIAISRNAPLLKMYELVGEFVEKEKYDPLTFTLLIVELKRIFDKPKLDRIKELKESLSSNGNSDLEEEFEQLHKELNLPLPDDYEPSEIE